MLVPSSNTVLEPYTSAMFHGFGDAASVHYARFRVVEISLSPASRGQFDLAPILEAAERLAETEPDVIVWNGTSASWLGLETDHSLCAAITDRTGIPATSTSLAFDALFRGMGLQRIAVVTPYLPEIQTRICRTRAIIPLPATALMWWMALCARSPKRGPKRSPSSALIFVAQAWQMRWRLNFPCRCSTLLL